MRRTLGFTTRASDETCIRPSEASCSELHFFLKESFLQLYFSESNFAMSSFFLPAYSVPTRAYRPFSAPPFSDPFPSSTIRVTVNSPELGGEEVFVAVLCTGQLC